MRIQPNHNSRITRMMARLRQEVCKVSGLGILLSLFSGCGVPDSGDEPMEPRVSDIPGELRVDDALIQGGQIQVVPVVQSDLRQDVSVTGLVGLDEESTVKVGSLVEGRVLDIKVKVGDRVRPGHLLAQLHSREVHEARADFVQAQGDLRTKLAELDYARNAAHRAGRLLTLKAGSLERQQRTQADLAQAELAVSSAQAEVARESEHLLHLGLDPTDTPPPRPQERPHPGVFEGHDLVSVTSPIEGTVLSRLVTVGTVVTPSEHLFVISDLSTVWVHADLPGQYLSSLDRQTAVEVSVQAYPGEVFEGRVYQIADVMNTDTRTVHVVCTVPNSGRRLKSEMYATITFGLLEVKAALTVPVDSIQTLGDDSVVFVERADGQFERRSIGLGRRAGGSVEILSGLTVGERVVAQGSFLLKSEFSRAQIEEE